MFAVAVVSFLRFFTKVSRLVLGPLSDAVVSCLCLLVRVRQALF